MGKNFTGKTYDRFLNKSSQDTSLRLRKKRSIIRAAPFLILVFSLASSLHTHSAPATFTWNSAVTSTTWLNSGNWTGGTLNKVPGIDNNASSTIDNDPNDTATIGAIAFSGSTLGINFNTSANTGVGNSSGANGLLSLGAINFTSASKAITIGDSSTVASGILQLNGATLNPGAGNINNVLVAISDSASQNLTIADLAGGSGVTMDLKLGITAGNIYVANARALTISDKITELNPNSGFTKIGSGTLILSAVNTYSGPTTISAGQLTIANDTTTLGSGSGALVLAGGTLFRAAQVTPQVFSNPLSLIDNSTISGDPASGTRSVIFSTSTLTLTSGKTLTIRNTGTAGSVMELRFTAGALNWTTPMAIGTVPDSGIAQLALANDNTVADQSINGIISGPGRIVRIVSTANPGGNALISNGANTYSGGTDLRAGFVGLGADNPLGTGPVTIGWDPNPLGLYASGSARVLTNSIKADVIPAGGTNLQIRGAQPLTLSGQVLIHTNLQFFTISNSALTTFSGVITNAGIAAAGLVKQGLGILKLAGLVANTYSGSSTVAKGTLQLANISGNSIPSSSILISNSATLQLLADEQIANTCIATLNSGGTFDLNGKMETIDTIQSSVSEKTANAVTTASISLGSGSLLLNPGSAAAYNIGTGISGFFGNIIGASGSKLQLTSSATGEFRLLKNGNSFEQLIVNGGTFQAGHIAGQDGESIFGAVPPSLKPDAITLANAGRIGASFAVSLHANRGITLNSGGGVFRTDTGSMTIPGPITGIGALIKNTTGTLTLQGPNDFTGGTTISSGSLVVSASGSLAASTGALVVNGGQLILNNAAQTIGSVSGTGGFIGLGNGHTLTINQSINSTYAGIIQNAGSLLKTGPGILTLTGIETFSGDTLLAEGTLALSGFGSFSSSPNITVNAGATLDVSDAVDGEYLFQTGQSLKGNGAIKGTVVIAPGATLSPGTSIGTLYFTNSPNLQGYAAMEINKTALSLTNDKLVVVGNPLHYDGILSVTLINGSDPLTGGEIFDLFHATSFDGSFFSADLPVLAPDLNWWTDKLPIDGTLIVNRAPIAQDKTYTRTKGTTFKVAKADLLIDASDPDTTTGDSFAYDALADNGLQGATLSEDNRYIYYEPANDNSDTLQYRLKDMRGGHVTKNIHINVVTPAGLAQNVTLNDNVATVRFAGIPGFPYQIQRSIDLEDWVDLLITNTPLGGVFKWEDHFIDLGSPPPSAYYRLRQP